MRELMAYAARRGVSVHVAHLPQPYRGFYDADARRIVFDFGLTPIERRVVLAHELGHDHFGHTCEDDHRSEQAADEFAAQLLIDPERYAQIEAVTHDTTVIAEELAVTPDLIHIYQQHCLTRLRGVTYSHARMGKGQWHYRSAHA